jgi:choice-of-anchor B domain-containing protein
LISNAIEVLIDQDSLEYQGYLAFIFSKRMRKTLLTLLIINCGLLAAQTPCVDGMAGAYPCERIDLQYFMPLSEMDNAPGLNDIWGWTDPLDNREYALVGMIDGTAFVDITNPLAPIYIGELPTHSTPSTWRDIKVYNNYAFIVSEAGGHGMQVFDLTRLRSPMDMPVTYTEDAHYAGMSNSHNIVLNETTGYAYPVGTDQASGGPMFVNIQDPLNPILEGSFSDLGYSHDAQVVTYTGPDTEHLGSEIYFGFHGYSADGLVIVDVTDKSDAEELSVTGYDCDVYTHQGWITPDMRYCFLNDEIDEATFGFNTRTRIFDISDLDAPTLLGQHISNVTSTDHNLNTLGSLAFMSNYTSGLRVVDFSRLDEGIMEEVASFDVHPEDNNAGYSGTWSNYPYFPSGNIVVTHRTTGLFIVKVQYLSKNLTPISVQLMYLYQNLKQVTLQLALIRVMVLSTYSLSKHSYRVSKF